MVSVAHSNTSKGSVSSGIVLFDGECNLCSGVVQWLIPHDPSARLQFASLQSVAGQHLLRSFGVPHDTDSVVVIADGVARTQSDAALLIGQIIGGHYAFLARIGLLVPRPVRNLAYNVLAANRYRLFGKKDECWIPTSQLRARFLPDS
jgi:predicted DCC family thiol-disulfide oxidoreductase YuxK